MVFISTALLKYDELIRLNNLNEIETSLEITETILSISGSCLLASETRSIKEVANRLIDTKWNIKVNEEEV